MATYKEAFDQAQILTEKTVRDSIEKQVLNDLAEAARQIEQRIERLYARILNGLDEDEIYNALIQYNRLNKLLDDVAQIYTQYARRAADLIKQGGLLSVQSYYRYKYILTWFSPNIGVTLNFALLDPRLAEFAVTGLPEIWRQIKDKYPHARTFGPNTGTLIDLLQKNRTEEILQIRQLLSQMLIAGNSYKKTVGTLRKILDTNAYKAMRIIRTEGNRLLNIGHYQNSLDAIDQGLEMQKQWLSTLDTRTRDSHRALDGQQKNIDERFVSPTSGNSALFPGEFGIAREDIHCRCTYMDLVPGLTPEVRRGKNPITGKSEVFKWKDYETWLNENGQVINNI